MYDTARPGNLDHMGVSWRLGNRRRIYETDVMDHGCAPSVVYGGADQATRTGRAPGIYITIAGQNSRNAAKFLIRKFMLGLLVCRPRRDSQNDRLWNGRGASYGRRASQWERGADAPNFGFDDDHQDRDPFAAPLWDTLNTHLISFRAGNPLLSRPNIAAPQLHQLTR